MNSGASSNTFVRAIRSQNISPFGSLPVLSGFANEFNFAEKDNWDGRGAVALSSAVKRLAEQLITRYAGTTHLVEIAPGRESSLSFVWDDDHGNYVYLDVGPVDTVHLFYEVIGEPKWEGVSVASDPRILDQLARAFQFLHPRGNLPLSAPIFIPSNQTVEYRLAA